MHPSLARNHLHPLLPCSLPSTLLRLLFSILSLGLRGDLHFASRPLPLTLSPRGPLFQKERFHSLARIRSVGYRPCRVGHFHFHFFWGGRGGRKIVSLRASSQGAAI
ncbi:hypothetical protein IE53DRAFT_122407 [Violaceomyces palustris]|uniref:Uncharacterized protein n=1 Tax=Violaceomyces palustris TaxID=1673888 RepID=A0ACD0NVN4_9BASI|nr:hypothetical protein IE53DRAFT_122407 [Violaceomyces palustris]